MGARPDTISFNLQKEGKKRKEQQNKNQNVNEAKEAKE
jgi:hypothetical protein